jgi:hypothetical protein
VRDRSGLAAVAAVKPTNVRLSMGLILLLDLGFP